MKTKLIVIGIIFAVVFLCGCQTNETGEFVKYGSVRKIDFHDVFGGTFTDYQDIIYFNDGTILYSQDRSLEQIVLNRNGTFYFDKNYFEYDDVSYKFDNFRKVIYDDELPEL